MFDVIRTYTGSKERKRDVNRALDGSKIYIDTFQLLNVLFQYTNSLLFHLGLYKTTVIHLHCFHGSELIIEHYGFLCSAQQSHGDQYVENAIYNLIFFDALIAHTFERKRK